MNTGASLYKRVTAGLDSDERVIFPHTWKANRELYDRFIGRAYLVKQRNHPDAEIDWVWERNLESVMRRVDLELITQVYIVRVRLPWNEVRDEWLVDVHELRELGAGIEVIDTYIQAINLDTGKLCRPAKLEFEEHREKYKVVEVLYLVGWKSTFTPPPDR